MWNCIPEGPADNPHIDPGVYHAAIHCIGEGTDGTDQPCVTIVLRLEEFDLYFVTTLGLPCGGAMNSEQRFWHLCAFAGLAENDGSGPPGLFAGRRLRVQIARMNRSGVNSGSSYFDVARFLPLSPEEQPSFAGPTPQDRVGPIRVPGNATDAEQGGRSKAALAPPGSDGTSRRGDKKRRRAMPASALGSVPLPDQVRA
jgi:hypothetical protein